MLLSKRLSAMKISVTIIIIVILLCFGVFYINNLDGERLSLNDNGYFSEALILNEVGKKLKRFTSSEKSQNTKTFQAYKWKDEKGVVHYSDQNSSRFKSKLTELKPITIVPANKTKPIAKPSIDEIKHVSNLPGLTTIPVHQIPKLIEDSKQVKKLLEERKDNMDEVINSY